MNSILIYSTTREFRLPPRSNCSHRPSGI